MTLTHVVAALAIVLPQQPNRPPTLEPAGSVQSAPALDSLRSENTQRLQRDSLYIALLERTNQQLNASLNPYGLFVSMLGVLFAAGAIVAGFLLYRQGAEYKALMTEAIARFDKALREMATERIEELAAQQDAKFEDAKSALMKANGEERKRLEDTVAGIEADRAQLHRIRDELRDAASKPFSAAASGSLGFSSTPSTFSQSLLRTIGTLTPTVCIACGKSFAYDPSAHPSTGLLGLKTIPCPHCGKKNTAL